jgi:hypothetical protein
MAISRSNIGFEISKSPRKRKKKRGKKSKIPIVMKEFKAGKLRSGSKKGPKVKSPKQAIAIALSEERKTRKKKKRKKKHV